MNLTKTTLKWAVCFCALVFSITANSSSVRGNQEHTFIEYEAFISVYDTSILNITNDAGVAHLDAYDQSIVNINASASHINAYDQSTVNVYGGGDISFLTMHNESTTNIYSGNFSWVTLNDNSQANIYGLATSWFLLGLDSHATIYGHDLNYSNGRVSGKSLDGLFFDFDILNIDKDGLPLEGSIPTNITLKPVPLPAPLFLFISGLTFLFKYGYKKS
jgi:hypothetical protein